MIPIITIVTPSYNRSKLLNNLFESLLSQTNKNFKWILLDDGSTDNTFKNAEDYKQSAKFEIKYFRHDYNIGKHKLINQYINFIDTKLMIIVDSDDILESSAIERIYNHWKKNKEINLSGMVFLKASLDNGKIIGNNFPIDNEVCSHLEMRVLRGVAGDKAEVWLTEVFRSIPFSEFENENFISEFHKYVQISIDMPLIHINEPIYLCKYLEGGISKNIRRLQEKNPKGALVNSICLIRDDLPKVIRLRGYIQAIYFSLLSKNFSSIRKLFYSSPMFFITALPFVFSYKLLISLKDNLFENLSK